MTDLNFPIDENTRVSFINETDNERWPNWKLYKNCNDVEKSKVNLASVPKNYVIFDKDFKNYTDEQINDFYKNFKSSLEKRNIKSYYSWRSPHGFHVLAKFKDLNNLDESVQKKINEKYIDLFGCDRAKVSHNGLISLPDRPHFKNNITYGYTDFIDGENEIDTFILEKSKTDAEEEAKLITRLNKDKSFENYFEEDGFFKFIKTNVIPDGTGRDFIIFPNLAIAAIKSGKSLAEIKNIIEPIIIRNFPGKIYAEFEGWLKKAMKNEINTYNEIQLNTWAKDNFKTTFYDVSPLKATLDEVETVAPEKNSRMKVYWDSELDSLENIKIEWVIDKWIPRGDITFIAGKSASYKTILALHCSYAISQGKSVFNNYNTMKSKVLYLNEENSRQVLLNYTKMVKKGLDISTADGIGFSIMENIRIDKSDDVLNLIDFIKKNKIEVLILDSFRRFIGFDENNATEMNRLFNNLKAIRNSVHGNLTIIVLHHLKKDGNGGGSDVRDLLRGSSDIVNSCDSIIGIARKHGSKMIRLEHIKNRSGEEMVEKVVTIDLGENKDMFYLYENNNIQPEDKKAIRDLSEQSADDIVNLLYKKKLTVFQYSDVSELEAKYGRTTLHDGIKNLKAAGEIIAAGKGKGRGVKYVLNSEKSKNSQSTLDKVSSDDIEELIDENNDENEDTNNDVI